MTQFWEQDYCSDCEKMEREIDSLEDSLKHASSDAMSLLDDNAKLQAENERLRGLVKKAYIQGYTAALSYSDRQLSRGDWQNNSWNNSDIKQELEGGDETRT